MLNIFGVIRKRPFIAFNVILSLCLLAGLVKPMATDWVISSTRTEVASRRLAVAAFSDFSGFMRSLSGAIAGFKDSLNPVIESTVGSIQKKSAAKKETVQAGLNFDAAAAAKEAQSSSVDLVGNETPGACDIKKSTAQMVDAKNSEGLMARAMTAAGGRRALYNKSASGEMTALLATSMSDYCSPESFARGGCKAGVSPLSMPDADVNVGTIMGTSDGMTQTLSPQEFAAAKKYTLFVVNPVPAEALPIALEKTPAGQRYLVEMRRRQAISSAAEYSLNRITASRWEKK